MKVLFSRGWNDFEHVYDLPSVPRVGEKVGLLRRAAGLFIVKSVTWTPDHTAYDVSVSLERLL